MFDKSVSKAGIAVSIIIPIYNVSKYLRQALDSCLNQTFQNFEIICVDDCSTDNSLEILKEYVQKDERIKVVEFKKNRGQGYARNYALYKVARGECVMFLDPDDWYEPETLELAYNQIINNNNDFVIFGYKKFDEQSGEAAEFKRDLLPFEDVFDETNIKLSDLDVSFIKTCFIWKNIYKRDFLIKNKVHCSEDLRLGEDLEFFVRAIISSDTVSVLNRYLYNYRNRKDSSSLKIELCRQQFKSRRRGYRLIKQYKPVYLNSYVPYLIRCYMHYYKRVAEAQVGFGRYFYTEMRKDFLKLNNLYDIEKYKDQILYEKFLQICEKSWNERRNIYFRIPNIIVVKLNKKGHYVTKLFNKFIITRNKFNKFKSRMFSVRDTKNGKHKLFKILGIKIKIKKKNNIN